MAKADYRTFLDLMRCGKWVDTIYNRALKEEAMTVTQYETLLGLVENGPMKQIGIVQSLGSDSGSVPRLIDRLEREGLVRRGSNKEDARSCLVEVTPSGRKKMVGVLEKIRKATNALSDALSERELEAFSQGLEKIMKRAREIRK